MRKTLEVVAPALACVAGLWLLFYPMLGSGFALMQSDLGDTRHLNYVLEHGYRWLAGDPHHQALWSPPVFFPQKETLAYSESLVGLQLVYAPWRALAFAPDTSMQLMMLLSSVLNFVVVYVLLRREIGTSMVGACFGAFLFAFGSMRGAQTGHQHLLPHFFTALAVLAALRVSRTLEDDTRKRQAILWLAVFFFSIVGQIYAGLYLGWFLCFALLIGICWALAFRQWRAKLWQLLRLHWPVLLTLAVLSALALSPLVIPYRKAASDVGFRSYAEVTTMLPRLQSWFYLGRFNLTYGWLHSFPAFNRLPLFWEHEVGLGLITTTIVLIGLWHGRRDPRVLFFALVAGTVVLLITFFPGRLTLWRVVYVLVPGAKAMRGMTRIALLLLIPASIGAALFVDRMLKGTPRLARGAVAVVITLCLLEQARSQLSYDKAASRRRIDEVARLVPSGCRTFYYSVLQGPQVFIYDQLEAMWASMNLGIPTVNGYSSNYPPGWGTPMTPGLLFNAVSTSQEEEQLGRFLNAWTELKGLPRDAVCWVRVRGS